MKCDNCGDDNKHILFNIKWESEIDGRTHQGYFCTSCAISGNYFLIRNDKDKK
jgi:hypothetical protein